LIKSATHGLRAGYLPTAGARLCEPQQRSPNVKIFGNFQTLGSAKLLRAIGPRSFSLGQHARLFAQRALVVVPGAMNGLAILIPVRVGIRGRPILFQAGLNVVVPFGILVAIMSFGAVAETQGMFHVVVIRLAARRDGLLAGGLLDG